MKRTYPIALLIFLHTAFSSMAVNRIHLNTDEPSDKVSFKTAPLTVPSAQQYTLEVNYTASDQRDVYVILYKQDWTWVSSSKVTVKKGQGALSFVLKLSSPLPAGTGYHWKCSIRPFKADWESELDKEEINNVTVEAPASDEIVFLGAPRSVIQSKSYPLVVKYAANVKRDIYVHLFAANWVWLGSQKKTVEAGSGTATLSIDLDKTPVPSSEYIWKCEIRPFDATWEEEIQSQIISNISIKRLE